MRILPILLAALLTVSPALAGTRAIYAVVGRKDHHDHDLQVEIADNGDARIEYLSPIKPSLYIGPYTLLIGNTAYLVWPNDQVQKIEDLKRINELLPLPPSPEEIDMASTGVRFKPALERQKDIQLHGRTGTVYRMTGLDDYPAPSFALTEIVVSDDPALAMLRHGIRAEIEARYLNYWADDRSRILIGKMRLPRRSSFWKRQRRSAWRSTMRPARLWN